MRIFPFSAVIPHSASAFRIKICLSHSHRQRFLLVPEGPSLDLPDDLEKSRMPPGGVVPWRGATGQFLARVSTADRSKIAFRLVSPSRADRP